jgi:hypothetical protein
MVELAALVRRQGPASRAKGQDQMLPSPVPAMEASEPCRTDALGGHVSCCAHGQDDQ